MFYQDSIDNNFRFGDVIRGFVASTPNINEPLFTMENNNYNIEISIPSFCAIVSPCCSISDKVISLSPLIPVRNTFFTNPYFAEDLTRINRLVTPEKSVPPMAWEKMQEDKKQERIDKGNAYAFLELFIYDEHKIFQEYQVNLKGGSKLKTRYLMIDFRNTFRVNCVKIKSPINVPIEAKCLQLSLETRSELRDKIATYYTRVPIEDLVAD